MNKFDLHIHSNYSDGKLSVPELATIIKKEKLNFCSLTDHNTIDGIQELRVALKGSGVEVIAGVELTAKHGANETHILAYDFDIDKAADIVRERNELVRCQKIKEMEKAIYLFRKEGFKISEGLVPLDKQPVTLTTALDICANRFNQEIFIKRHGRELMPEDVYYEYQAPNKSCSVERSGVTVEWLVHKFKLVAKDLIVAHPFVSVSVVTKPFDEVGINSLLQLGITGIEVYHNNTSDEQISLLKKIVNEQGLHYTGGSDFHGNKMTDVPLGKYGSDRDIPDFCLSSYSLK